jgi:hypothetical protein
LGMIYASPPTITELANTTLTLKAKINAIMVVRIASMNRILYATNRFISLFSCNVATRGYFYRHLFSHSTGNSNSLFTHSLTFQDQGM